MLTQRKDDIEAEENEDVAIKGGLGGQLFPPLGEG